MKANKVLLVLGAFLISGAAYAKTIEKTYAFDERWGQTEVYFYCTATDANDDDQVVFKNKNEMIRGFDKHGHLTLKVADVNKYYFTAKHDIKKPDKRGMVTYTLTTDQNAADITCYYGQGKSRQPLSGGWGLGN